MIAITTNDKSHMCTKHINLRYHFICGLIRDNTLDIQYIPTDDNLADTFTKALPHPHLEMLCNNMGVHCTQEGVL